MLVGYMRVSSETDRQNTNLQKDALIKCDIDERNIGSLIVCVENKKTLLRHECFVGI
jgi:DNA invertase Pin-like site-specific DNA recombinase